MDRNDAYFTRQVDDTPNQRQQRKAMTTFKATTEGTDKLRLRAGELRQRPIAAGLLEDGLFLISAD